jgi:Tol biopolymer transport system component/DNA-binding winged helix-turn-helix (wHTH) protein
VQTPSDTAYQFGQFEVNTASGELFKNGKRVRLQEQPFRLLVVLLENAGEVVTREDLRSRIWQEDTFVDFDGSLRVAVRKLREALDDDAEKPRFVETIPRRGYRFIAPIENGEPGNSASATPKAQIENGEPAGDAASITPIAGDRKSTARADQERVSASSYVRATLPVRPLFATKVLVALALLAILAATLLGYRVLRTRAKQTLPKSQFSNMRITQLTSLPGNYESPTFSPDGRQIAFFWNGENRGHGDLYVQLVGGEKALRLTHTSTGFVCCADWSPDGKEIVFGRCSDGGGAVFIIPALGGSERKLADVACPWGDAGYAQWTADGKSLVLADSCAPDAPRGIVVFSLQTGEKRCLHSPPAGDIGDVKPRLSPDEKTVAFLRSQTWPEIYTVAFSGGNLRQLTHKFFHADSLDFMWSADGKYITFEPTRDRMARVAASGGPVEFEAVYPKIGALSRDHRRLAYVEPSLAWRWSPVVWRIRLTHAGGKVISQARILVAATGGNDSAQLSADEQQLVFQSMRSGTHQIWRSNADGSDLLQLTSFDQGYPGTPRGSPDGKWIAFDYRTTATSQIYLVNSEGRNFHALTSGNYEDRVPSWSRDGKAVYFASNRTGNWQIWRRELSGRKETQITRQGGFAGFESYDAKALYYSKFEGGGIWKVPVGGGQEERVTDSLHLGYWGHFAVTENGLYLVDSDAKGGPAIMYYNVQTRRLSSVLTFKQFPFPWLPNLAASRDGRTLFYAPIEFESAMISMVENFQ